MKRLAGCVLIVSLAWASVPMNLLAQAPSVAGDDVRGALERIPLLADVDVRLTDGSRLKGVLVAKTDDALTVRPRGERRAARQVPLASVASIRLKPAGEGMSGRTIAILGVVGFGVVALVVVLRAAAGA